MSCLVMAVDFQFYEHFITEKYSSFNVPVTTQFLGLYRSSAPAPAEIRPFLQIRLISGSGQNWAGFEILSDLENFH